VRTATQLKHGRRAAGLTQAEASQRLDVSQPYLSLLETGQRALTARVARAAARVYSLPATFLPVSEAKPGTNQNSDRLVRYLAALGYPGYEHVSGGATVNPATFLADALVRPELDARVAQALPWVVARYFDLDWNWLVSQAKLRDAQNRLGFVVTLARQLQERHLESEAAARLSSVERQLEASRLLAETTMGRESMPPSERLWLRTNRSAEALRWNVLTSLTAEQLRYAP
jgi:transcriptional regulator with XRE-family HTH domain